MPAKSKAQNRFIHAAANRGESWAAKWLDDSHGQKVSRLPEYSQKGNMAKKSNKKKFQKEALRDMAKKGDKKSAKKGKKLPPWLKKKTPYPVGGKK